jgi:hypothetical protein
MTTVWRSGEKASSLGEAEDPKAQAEEKKSQAVRKAAAFIRRKKDGLIMVKYNTIQATSQYGGWRSR